MTHATILEFDIVVDDPGDAHGICLDSDLDGEATENTCITLLQHPDSMHFLLTTQLVVGVAKHLVIPVGAIRGLVGGESDEINYIVFLQDNDVGD